MSKFTQQELMASHNDARHNAEVAQAKASSEATVIEPVDPYRKPTGIEEDVHPFGGNDNNKRVAERIAAESKQLKEKSLPKPLTPAQAAEQDLQKAKEYESKHSDEEIVGDEVDDDGETPGEKKVRLELAAKAAQQGIPGNGGKPAASAAAAVPPAPPTGPSTTPPLPPSFTPPAS